MRIATGAKREAVDRARPLDQTRRGQTRCAYQATHTQSVSSPLKTGARLCSTACSGSSWIEQRRDGDLCLGAGEPRSQAKMRATTKGEMRGVRTLDVEAMRIGMQRRVMPSSEQRTGHRLTGLHLPATDLQGLQRKASDLHHRRVVAQHLLDRMGYELGMRAQIGQLIGMSK